MTDPAALDGAALNVTLWLSSGRPAQRAVETQSLFVERAGSGVDLVAGGMGQAFRGHASAGSALRLGRLRLTQSGSPSDLAQSGYVIESATLCFVPDGAGGFDLDASGTLTIIDAGDDYDHETPSYFRLQGVPDSVPPAWPEDDLELNPLHPELVPVSEPLTPSATATLATSTPVDLLPVEQEGYVIGFEPGQVLALGESAAISAHASDLAGLALARGGFHVTTPADPGVQPLDGFESVFHAVTFGRTDFGEPTLVHGAAAITGDQSLLVPGGVEALFHLHRSDAAAKRLRLRLEPVLHLVETPVSIVLRAGVVGQTRMTTLELPFEPNFGQGTAGAGGEGGAGGAGGQRDVRNVELGLLGAGEDVLFSVEAPGVELSASAFIDVRIDDLRLE